MLSILNHKAVFFGFFLSVLVQPVAYANTVACAEEAGSPEEPDFNGGINYADIRISTAINACESAVAEERSPANLYRLARALYKAERYQQSMSLAEESAVLGYGPASALLGYALLAGNPVTEIDNPRALSLFKNALALGVASAARNLGYMYQQGVGVRQSDAQAARYYLAGSELGDAMSQYWTGWLYQNIKELGKTSEEASNYYRLSADQMYDPAILALGFALEMGNGVTQDLKQALEYYKRASDNGLSDATPHFQRLQRILAYQSDLNENDWQPAVSSVTSAVMDQAVVQTLEKLLPEPVIESIYLPFYDSDTRLVRARYAFVAGAPVASYFLYKADELTHLDGDSTPIHQFNAKNPLYLHAPVIAEHYLRFFTFFTRGDLNGQFLIVESNQDRLVPEGLSLQELALMDQKLAPLECKADENSGYLCQADVYYIDNIFRASMTVPMNGRVGMSDENVIIKGLSKRVYSPITLAEIEKFIYTLPMDTPIGVVEVNVLSGLSRIQLDSEMEAANSEIARLTNSQNENKQQQQVLDKELDANEQARQSLTKERDTLAAALEIEKLILDALGIIADTGRNQEAFDKLTAAAAKNNLEAEHELSLFYLYGNVVERDEKRALEMIQNNAEAGFVRAQATFGKFLYKGIYVKKDPVKALQYNTLAAQQGNAQAQYTVGLQYDFGNGVEKNDSEALKWYQKSADQGNADAQFRVGETYDLAEGVPQDYAEAVKWYKLASAQGSMNAKYNLGLKYYSGLGVNENKAQAHQLYMEAAEQGLAQAQLAVAMNYDAGDSGVAVDQTEALKWYQKAAEQGLAKAQYDLARKYEFGESVNRDQVQAHKLYILAARQGYMPAQRSVAINFSLGEGGVDVNQKAAVKWYQKAADQGDSISRYYLGIKYDYGRGVKQDKVQAHKLYMLAADQGYASAQYAVGINYAYGEGGVALNERAAANWFRMAAEQGYAKAQGALGVRYVNGTGVPKDRGAGIQWLKKAAAQGHEKSIENLRTLGEY